MNIAFKNRALFLNNALSLEKDGFDQVAEQPTYVQMLHVRNLTLKVNAVVYTALSSDKMARMQHLGSKEQS